MIKSITILEPSRQAGTGSKITKRKETATLSRRFPNLSIFLLAASILLYGCSAETNKYNVKSLIISPAAVTVNPSSTQQFSCKAIYGDSAARNFNPEWSVSDPLLGSIDQSGLFKASANINASAEVIVTARYNGIYASAEAVIDPFSIGPMPPQNITFSSVTPYSLKVTWTDCSADGYLVSVGIDSNADKITFETTTNSVDIKSLGASVLYYFKVRSYKTAQGIRVYSGFSPV
ncbi:MAG: fibronectin type III domain-containing protein, partial [Candidatus Margulisiibacteriota bacterium]